MTKDFPNTGPDFSGYYAAEAWCWANGYSTGSMQAGAPIGILKGGHAIPKWRRLSADERKSLDGTIESANFRSGTVTIKIKGTP